MRRDLAQRYHTLLIDEFQDTDPIQIEIAVLIASDDPEAGQKPWHEVTLPPGRLFFVGDPKQSIYRFRRADIDLYNSAARRFGGSPTGSTANLVQNFRSVPSVLDWVNHTLGTLLQLERTNSGEEAVGQVEFEPLEAWRTADERSPVAVHLLGEPLSSSEFKADTMRALEATRIAALVAQEGRALVIAVNKWDLVSGKKQRLKELQIEIERLVPQVKGVRLVPISALKASGLTKLMTAVFDVYETWNRRIPTAALTRWLYVAQERHPPPAVSGKRIRLRFMTQPNARPPTFVVFASRAEKLPESYRRYLIQGLRAEFDLPAVPIRLSFKKGKNPYASKRRRS